MPLYIDDETTTKLIDQLATLRGLTKQDAIRAAVVAELERPEGPVPRRVRFAALRKAYPLPAPTGELADKPNDLPCLPGRSEATTRDLFWGRFSPSPAWIPALRRR